MNEEHINFHHMIRPEVGRREHAKEIVETLLCSLLNPALNELAGREIDGV